MRSIAVREDIDDLILDAADRLLARYGFKKMTMDDLAREVGIGKGTIYLHFRSKEEIVLSHVDRIVERLLSKLRAIADGNRPPDKKIREMLAARVIFRFDSVQHYTESLSDVLAAIRSPLLDRRQHYFEREALEFSRVLKEGKHQGIFAFRSATDSAYTLLLATNSLLPFSLTTRELGERDEIEAQTRRIADMLLQGLVRRH
jgi:AcrR family transcriptional regulator